MTQLPATLTQLQSLLSTGFLSASESLESQKTRFDAHRAQHACVVDVLDASHSQTDSSRVLTGPLSGIGLAHKDIFDLAGWLPGLGHTLGRASAEQTASTAITRLAQAGASQFATLAMAEYACGATGLNPNFPPILNPLGTELAVGGSSSGSAVAVASELVYGALGTDTAGSVRIPATTCGLVGLKTTHGLISTQGVYPLAPSLDGIGLLTRSAADAQALLSLLIETKPQRPALATPRLKAWLPEEQIHADVSRALEDFLRQWPAGERLKRLPEHGLLTSLSEIVLYTEVAATHRQALFNDTLCAGALALALPGLAIPEEWYLAALRDRARQAKAFFEAHLKNHDIFMLPALPQPIPAWSSVTPGSSGFDVRQLLALHSFMGFVNYLGFPSVVIPISHDARNLPISAQFIARPGDESTLLAFASQIERERFGSHGFTRPFTHLS